MRAVIAATLRLIAAVVTEGSFSECVSQVGSGQRMAALYSAGARCAFVSDATSSYVWKQLRECVELGGRLFQAYNSADFQRMVAAAVAWGENTGIYIGSFHHNDPWKARHLVVAGPDGLPAAMNLSAGVESHLGENVFYDELGIIGNSWSSHCPSASGKRIACDYGSRRGLCSFINPKGINAEFTTLAGRSSATTFLTVAGLGSRLECALECSKLLHCQGLGEGANYAAGIGECQLTGIMLGDMGSALLPDAAVQHMRREP